MTKSSTTWGVKRREKYVLGFGGETQENRPLGRHRIDRRIISISILKKEWEGVQWSGLAGDRVKWQYFVNKVMNFRVPLNAVYLD